MVAQERQRHAHRQKQAPERSSGVFISEISEREGRFEREAGSLANFPNQVNPKTPVHITASNSAQISLTWQLITGQSKGEIDRIKQRMHKHISNVTPPVVIEYPQQKRERKQRNRVRKPMHQAENQ